MTNPTAQKNPWGWFTPYPAWNEDTGFDAGQTDGSGGATSSTVVGPYFIDGLLFWCDTEDCKVGMDIGDGDPDPDVWLNYNQLKRADIETRQKQSILAQMQALGCWTNRKDFM